MAVLELIAEAQKRQHKAERERDHWKAVAASKNLRCKRLVEMLRLRNLPTPVLDVEHDANWEQLTNLVGEVALVFADPYARFPDDEDEYASLTHERARDMLAYRLQRMIKAAAER